MAENTSTFETHCFLIGVVCLWSKVFQGISKDIGHFYKLCLELLHNGAAVFLTYLVCIMHSMCCMK